MAVQLHYGMDHEHYDWSPFNHQRKVLRWPQNARVALAVIVNLEHMEWQPPEGAFQILLFPGVMEPAPFRMSPAGPTGNTATGWGFSGSWTCWKSTVSKPRWQWTC